MRTTIEHVGQRWIDEPTYTTVHPKAIVKAAAELCGNRIPKAIVMQTGTRRVPLVWMKPDGMGGLMPRSAK